MGWQTVPLISSGLALAAFFIAGIFYYLRYLLQQRVEIIKSTKLDDRLDAIALTADQFRVDVGGLEVGQKTKIVLEQIAIRRRRDLLIAITVLVLGILATLVTIVAIVRNPENRTEDRGMSLRVARDICAGVAAKFADAGPEAQISFEQGHFTVRGARQSVTVFEDSVPIGSIEKFSYTDYNRCVDELIRAK
jgi:hypothetical protein